MKISIHRCLTKQANQEFLSQIEIGDRKVCWPWKGSLNRDGYGIYGNSRAHRHMAQLMRLGELEGVMVLHSCDNPKYCNPRHLRIGTHADNMRDRMDRDRTAKAESNGRAKLTEAQVREIRSAIGTVREIAVRYGMNYGTIADIRARRTWQSVK